MFKLKTLKYFITILVIVACSENNKGKFNLHIEYKDSHKQEAITYLLTNMPYAYSYDTTNIHI